MALALSASTIKSWFQYGCHRKTRYETLSRSERDAIPILRDSVAAPWAALGNDFEHRVVSRLAAETGVLRPVGDDYLGQALSVDFLQGNREEEYAAQVYLNSRGPLRERLKLSDDVTIRVSYPDLVRINRRNSEPVFQVIDIKATQRATVFHKTQVAFYSLLLQSTLADLGASGSVSPSGQIWCLPGGSHGQDGLYQVDEFRLEPYRRLVLDFLQNEIPRIAASVVSKGRDDTFFHIYFKCEQCEYLRHCQRAIEGTRIENRDVSAVAGLSHQAKRALRDLGSNGIRTVGALAGAHGLRANSEGSWSLRRRADLLTKRAQSLIDGRIQRIPGVASFLMPARVDVGFYIVVDVDPVEGNLITLGYSRCEKGATKHAVEILPDGSRELESQAICKVLGQLVDDLAHIDRHNANHEDSPSDHIYAHIFLYEPSEAVGLQDAVARHIENPLVRSGLLHLIRMFPPEDMVPEPEFRGMHHLPATALRSVVEQVFALPIMVSYDLRQVTESLAAHFPSLLIPYSPQPPFKRPFSSQLSIDVCRSLRDGRNGDGAVGVDDVRKDVTARLDASQSLAEWLMQENADALARPGDHAFLRLNKRPFRFQQTLNPLNAVDLDVLTAFELLENRAGMLDCLVSLAQTFSARRDRANCIAQMKLLRQWKTDWGSYSMLFSVPSESRESELSSRDLTLILTNDDPDIRLNPQLWPQFHVRIAPEKPEYSSRETLLISVNKKTFEEASFQRLIRETEECGWFLDRTYKDFTTGLAADFMAFLSEEPA